MSNIIQTQLPAATSVSGTETVWLVQAGTDKTATVNQIRGTLTNALVQITATVFSNAPASPVEGAIIAVTDSTTNVWGATVTGGSSNHVLAYYDGTNWTVMAK